MSILGKSFSVQTHGICRGIRQGDECLQNNTQWENVVIKSFRILFFKTI